jgi:hypothetical protein
VVEVYILVSGAGVILVAATSARLTRSIEMSMIVLRRVVLSGVYKGRDPAEPPCRLMKLT